MEHGNFHGFMKEYMEKTCPSKEGTFGNWCAFDEELNKYRNLSKSLKMCGYYSANLDCKIDEISKNVKELKELAKESKQIGPSTGSARRTAWSTRSNNG